MRTSLKSIVLSGALVAALPLSVLAQTGAPLPPPPRVPLPAAAPGAPLPPGAPAAAAPTFAAAELDRITSPIALYPDPLLAQVLAAATYADQIPDAERWADQHHELPGPTLAAAIQADQVPWDPSVQALLPFPGVLDVMASSLPWTEELGDAFLAQPQDVMDAVQRNRQLAYQYGYLRSTPQVQVTTGPYIEIVPVNPNLIVVPYYDPRVVFVRPARRVVRPAVVFGAGVQLGPFAVWGWGATRVAWPRREVIIANTPWHRTWVNRATYAHPSAVRRVEPPHAVERHPIEARTARERAADHDGHRRREEHR